MSNKSALKCKLKNPLKTNKQKNKTKNKTTRRPIWTQNGMRERGEESSFPSIKNQSETSIVKQLY